MKYIVNLEDDSQDEFDTEGKNVGEVKVFDRRGIDRTSDSRVVLELSKDALLGLGTELIRLSKLYKDGSHFHICPSTKNFISQVMGIFLVPESCEVIISCRDLGPIENFFENE